MSSLALSLVKKMMGGVDGRVLGNWCRVRFRMFQSSVRISGEVILKWMIHQLRVIA